MWAHVDGVVGEKVPGEIVARRAALMAPGRRLGIGVLPQRVKRADPVRRAARFTKESVDPIR